MRLTKDQKEEIRQARLEIKGKFKNFSYKNSRNLELLKAFLNETEKLNQKIENSVASEEQMSVRFDYSGQN